MKTAHFGGLLALWDNLKAALESGSRKWNRPIQL